MSEEPKFITVPDAYGYHLAQAHGALDRTLSLTDEEAMDREVAFATAHATVALAIANGRAIWNGEAKR